MYSGVYNGTIGGVVVRMTTTLVQFESGRPVGEHHGVWHCIHYYMFKRVFVYTDLNCMEYIFGLEGKTTAC